ncbi:uncharacterized protein BDCG_16835 [Blastomyces dermatitidis ER-3]|uniref:Uncharacterized protein n=3 Tax=Blastomyces TaxID=229219 RepID=A0A179UDD7_BLAGS|nr:uncharacterized protein BDBG_16267 [Blastomyces gilchristii SLH14081]XP_045280729.1 uncharacterized protein BDCG_16835 [Blastomyces dermatitidis ER-3]EQL32751.1 hypothetical protein BDFG_05138 [Blastomyces dermatitidis ATCC 26199]KMW67760.1 hypothetical protein BDDG_12303 [Blastomyces dermatitidis ATCC 18188]OAT01002.1 hypothetical protein BDCG_16835 [Blastomyces dermatitidis ER-3]OAT04512.1 hypothetical protein BDBG_16267 [Blastomyces gilchristii SLH14081]
MPCVSHFLTMPNLNMKVSPELTHKTLPVLKLLWIRMAITANAIYGGSLGLAKLVHRDNFNMMHEKGTLASCRSLQAFISMRPKTALQRIRHFNHPA